MHPILFKIGPFTLYAYTVLLDLGILAGIAVACWEGRRRGYPPEQTLEAALWALGGGIIGGRLAYILPNWARYAAQPLSILRVWGGGLAFHGALIGGGLGLGLYAARRSLAFWELGDLAALGLPLGQAFGWLGALLHGANYGRVSYEGWAWELPDLYGIILPRFPTQVVGSLLGILIFVPLLLFGRRRRSPGSLLLAYLLLNSAGHFLLEFTRGESLRWGPLQASQAMYLLEALAALGLLVYLRRGARKRITGLPPSITPVSEEQNHA